MVNSHLKDCGGGQLKENVASRKHNKMKRNETKENYQFKPIRRLALIDFSIRLQDEQEPATFQQLLTLPRLLRPFPQIDDVFADWPSVTLQQPPLAAKRQQRQELCDSLERGWQQWWHLMPHTVSCEGLPANDQVNDYRHTNTRTHTRTCIQTREDHKQQ